MEIEDLAKKYPDIEHFLLVFQDNYEFPAQIKKNKFVVSLPYIQKDFVLLNKDLATLNSYKKLKKNSDFEYLGDWGFRFKGYHEIVIQISHPDYMFWEAEFDLFRDPLSFKIDTSKFVIGAASPLFVLLSEPIYSAEFYHDFNTFTTIKLIQKNENDYKQDITKALYYLNSHYLKSIGFTASLNHMSLYDDDPLNLFDEENVSRIFKKVTRVRTRNRKDFISIEPLLLYNHSQNVGDEQNLLYLYRILEFFMDRAKETKLQELRYDDKIKESEILKVLHIRNERENLEILLKESIPKNLQKKTN